MQKIFGFLFIVVGVIALKDVMSFQEIFGVIVIVIGAAGFFGHDHAT